MLCTTLKYCPPAWHRSTRLIDSFLNYAMRLVTGHLRPIPTDYLPVLTGVQPAELRRQGTTLSLAYRSMMDLSYLLHQLMVVPIFVQGKTLRSYNSFVPAERKMLSELPKMSIRSAQWINFKWKMKYFESLSEFRFFVQNPSTRHLAWICVNLLG